MNNHADNEQHRLSEGIMLDKKIISELRRLDSVVNKLIVVWYRKLCLKQFNKYLVGIP
jgi:hypothetical protein